MVNGRSNRAESVALAQGRHEAEWRTLWDAEVESLPTHRESWLWLVTGLLLPVWDRLPKEDLR